MMAGVENETTTTIEDKTIDEKPQLEGSTRGRARPQGSSEDKLKAQKKETKSTSANSATKQRSRRDSRSRKGKASKSGESESGIEQLIDAVDRTLGEEFESLSTAMATRAKSGSESAMKILIQLAERKKNKTASMKKLRGPTYGQKLAAEPPWEGGEPQQAMAGSAGAGGLVKTAG